MYTQSAGRGQGWVGPGDIGGRPCLAQADDGSAWATWVLEAATPARGYVDGYESWASEVLRRWEARDQVRDPAAGAWLAALPPLLPLWHEASAPEHVDVTLEDAQRAALEEAERRWLGIV